MKKIIICLFSLLLILCITGCNKEIDKEKIKEELHSYVDEIEKSEIINQEFKTINKYIDDEVNNLKSRNYGKNKESIKSNDSNKEAK